MTKLLPILFMSILLSAEMEVDGNLKVTGTIQNDSLAQVILLQQQQISALETLISQLQAQIALLESQMEFLGWALSIADCLGIVGGDAVIDDCGICDGDGVEQDCGCGSLGEFEIPEGECDCFGNIKDACGVCGGDAISEDECYALSFNGSPDYVDCGIPDNNFKIYEDDISWYIRFSNIQTGINTTLIGQSVGTGSKDKWEIMYMEDNRFCMHVNGGEDTDIASQWIFSDIVLLQQDVNYSLLISKENNDYSFSLDYGNDSYDIGGELGSSNIPYVEANLFIGKGESQYFIGIIDEISIWNFNINDIDMINFDQYNQYLIGSWSFNGSTDDILNDSSVNGNHGTINGATWVERE